MPDINLQKNILFTVAYFSACDFALTTFELWQNLFARGENRQKVSYADLLMALDQQPLTNKLVMKKGFITLKNEEKLIEERLSKQKLSLSVIRKTKKWINILGYLPYMRGIFLTGTLSMKNASPKSDWDIFVVLAKQRIWLGRFFLSLALQVLGKRRSKNKVARRFCLNHFVTENGLILEEHNEFCSNFVSFSFPVLGTELHRNYLKLNEHWINFHKPNYVKEEVLNETLSVREHSGKFHTAVEFVLEKSGMGKILNEIMKKQMIKKIRNNPATYFKNADIRYSDMTLVFLPKPHRISVLQRTVGKLTNCV